MKILIIAEAANPEWVSVPLVGWSLANAIKEKHDVHIITQIRNRDAFLRAGLTEGRDFTAIDSEAVAKPLYRLAELLRGGQGKGWTMVTAMSSLSYYYFELLIWAKFKKQLKVNAYDIVHRVTPLSPTAPSLLAKRCHKIGIPFILGPLNGGAPWPRQFDSVRRQEKEWLSYVRGFYKLLPSYKNTLKLSSALIVGSKHTFAQIPEKYHSKCIYIPENAIDPNKFALKAKSRQPGEPLRICFVGRLVPYKGLSMLLEACVELLKKQKIIIDVMGDGPEILNIKKFLKINKIESNVNLLGWVEHDSLQGIMCQSQLFVFPSIREFGGGAVLEAMALGLVPVVIDYAGPAEIVTEKPDIKYRWDQGRR